MTPNLQKISLLVDGLPLTIRPRRAKFGILVELPRKVGEIAANRLLRAVWDR